VASVAPGWWMSWTLIGAFGIRSNQANCMLR
jgi:hypothetical protein